MYLLIIISKNIGQNYIHVCCHSHKSTVASTTVALGQSEKSRASNQQTILSQRDLTEGPNDVLLNKALNPKVAPGHMYKI